MPIKQKIAAYAISLAITMTIIYWLFVRKPRPNKHHRYNNPLKRLAFHLIFSKIEKQRIREALTLAEDYWYTRFEETQWKTDWMNRRRNNMRYLKHKLFRN